MSPFSLPFLHPFSQTGYIVFVVQGEVSLAGSFFFF